MNVLFKKTTKGILNTAKIGSYITAITSSIKTGALVEDTSLNVENIVNLTKDGVLEGTESIRNFVCNGLNEIINFSDYLRENYNIPFPELKNEPLIDIEALKLDMAQIGENIGITDDFSPEKLENIITIAISVGAIGFIFSYLIPKTINKISQKI